MDSKLQELEREIDSLRGQLEAALKAESDRLDATRGHLVAMDTAVHALIESHPDLVQLEWALLGFRDGLEVTAKPASATESEAFRRQFEALQQALKALQKRRAESSS